MLTTFDYKITGTGWAELTLAANDRQVVVRVSYACDPLPVLLEALIGISKGEARFGSIYLDGENTEHDLLLTEIEPGVLRIELFAEAYFGQLEADIDDRTPMPVFTAYEATLVFCKQVTSALRAVLEKNGAAAYASNWRNFLFPDAALGELERLNKR